MYYVYWQYEQYNNWLPLDEFCLHLSRVIDAQTQLKAVTAVPAAAARVRNEGNF